MKRGEVRTIAEAVRNEFTVSGSRFIGHLAPVGTEVEANEVISSVEMEHPDATHVVTAYRLETDPVTEHADDDGEPGGSAGKPALGVLKSEELVDVVAVIVRYYGGTNLGYGGLVRAYARAVSDALDEVEVVTRMPTTTFNIETAYDDSGTVQGILESADTTFDASYDTSVSFTVTVEDDNLDRLIDRLRSATSGRVTIEGPSTSNRK